MKRLIIIGVVAALIIILFTQWENIFNPVALSIINKQEKIQEKRKAEYKREDFKPYAGDKNIKINKVGTTLKWTKEEFIQFRKAKINEMAILNFYPSNYDPFIFPHNEIYGSIDFNFDWITDSQFYACNLDFPRKSGHKEEVVS